MSGQVRAPGWYPDPWGTPEERYFDGVAWARTTRRPGGLDTPPVTDPIEPAATSYPSPPVAAAATSATAATAAIAGGATAGDATTDSPPGWHPDPWEVASLRYWDGNQWTGHVSGMRGISPAIQFAEERTAARWAKAGLAWGGPALGVSTITGAFQWHWIAEHWDEITAAGNGVQSNNGNNGAAIIGQMAGLVLLAAGILFMIWFYRAAQLAASSGLTARRSPGLATASFIIPIVNLWWPYQSTRDLLPENHPGRQVVKRWWALWIGCTIGGLAVGAAAFTGAVALAIATGITVVLALLAAVTARNVVTAIADAHNEFAASV